jgi:hypothetical protein
VAEDANLFDQTSLQRRASSGPESTGCATGAHREQPKPLPSTVTNIEGDKLGLPATPIPQRHPVEDAALEKMVIESLAYRVVARGKEFRSYLLERCGREGNE